MEVLEQIKDLVDVFILHLATSNTLTTRTILIGEDNLQ